MPDDTAIELHVMELLRLLSEVLRGDWLKMPARARVDRVEVCRRDGSRVEVRLTLGDRLDRFAGVESKLVLDVAALQRTPEVHVRETLRRLVRQGLDAHAVECSQHLQDAS